MPEWLDKIRRRLQELADAMDELFRPPPELVPIPVRDTPRPPPRR